MNDLGTLGGETSGAYAINDLGQVTGIGKTGNGESHAFFYDGTIMHDIGIPGEGSWGRDINDSEQIVGRGQQFRDFYAFFWSSEDGLLNLNDLIDPNDPLFAFFCWRWRVA